MAELIPAPFEHLVTRLYREPETQGTVFDLARRMWYAPDADSPDLSVRFHGSWAGSPLGPAAGPHTQMAQNLLLSYVAGARILELKTVQVKDRLNIPRTCIDMANVGYNVEWSQELRVPDSLREYVAGSMLVEMFRRCEDFKSPATDDTRGRVIYDMSLGYDLAGIRSDKVQNFLDQMRDTSEVVNGLRSQIPQPFAFARDFDYPAQLSSSVTLSTFHGCPAGEIESICEFLIGERDLDVIVKMNPPMLGKERLEHLLHEVMGYEEITVNPTAYTSGLQFDESVEICKRLTRFAAARGRGVGFKFSNTLEVINHREIFTPQVMYLSGQPLHLIAMTLTEDFRREVGPAVPISFSAGIDARNFADTVACGFVPITVSADLLRPGGYGRLPAYLRRLSEAMEKAGAATIDEYVINRFGQGDDAKRRAEAHPDVDLARVAGWCNTSVIAENARNDPRYGVGHNSKIPIRLDLQLETFDCTTCDKCIPVCPNDANFTYPTPIVAFDYHDILVDAVGSTRTDTESKHFEITEEAQIACYADFCNECGNCDTFCPEYGGPYIKKPSFFGTIDSWRQAASHDGFVVHDDDTGGWIQGRIEQAEFRLVFERAANRYTYNDGVVEAIFDRGDHSLLEAKLLKEVADEHRLNMAIYHTLHYLRDGILDKSRINQVNAAYASA